MKNAVMRPNMLQFSMMVMFGVCANTAAAAPIETPPTVHPIFVSAEGAVHDDEARSTLRQIVARRRMGVMETLDLPTPPLPTLAGRVKNAITHNKALKFSEAESELRSAMQEAENSGGHGLDTEGLSNLYLHLGIAIDKADWTDFPATGPPRASVAAADCYLRAATMTPARELYTRDFSPLARLHFADAIATVKAQPRGVLTVNGPSDAMVSVDGRPAIGLPLELKELAYGDHFIRVTAPGRQPWSELVPITQPTLAVEVPTLQAYRLDDQTAATHARRMAAAFALVVEMKPPGQVELRLIKVDGVQRLDALVASAHGDPAGFEAAVIRLDEIARRREMESEHGFKVGKDTELAVATVESRAPTQPPVVLQEDPSGWAEQHWPLLSAAGTAVALAIILGIAVSLD